MTQEPRRAEGVAIELPRAGTARVVRELGAWTAWLELDPDLPIHGFPLEGVLAELIGLNPAHDDIPAQLQDLARSVERDYEERAPGGTV